MTTDFLRPGRYWLDISASIMNVKVLDVVQNAISFEISGLNVENLLSQGRRGAVIPVLKWETTKRGEYPAG